MSVKVTLPNTKQIPWLLRLGEERQRRLWNSYTDFSALEIRTDRNPSLKSSDQLCYK